MYLSTETFSVIECCQKLNIDFSLIANRLKYVWVKELVMPSILMKLSICNLIEEKSIYMCSKEKYSRIEYYMKLYAEYLNNSNLTIQDMEQKYGINLTRGTDIDDTLGTTVFVDISDTVKGFICINNISKKKMKIYEYYQNHFILFRDLGPIFNIDQDSLEQCYQKDNQTMWNHICEIEKQRQSILQQDSQKLIKFAELIDNLEECKENKNDNKNEIFCKLSNLIQDDELMIELEKRTHSSYFKTLIKSANFITLYLNQQNYDIKNLIEYFQIRCSSTELLYLYHPFVSHLLSRETQQYIRTKRKISGILGGRIGTQHYLDNKFYLNREKNEKGQFVKKYQSVEAKNEM